MKKLIILFLSLSFFGNCFSQKQLPKNLKLKYSDDLKILDSSGNLEKLLKLSDISIQDLINIITENDDEIDMLPICNSVQSNCKWKFKCFRNFDLIIYPIYPKGKLYWNIYKNEKPNLKDILDLRIDALEVLDGRDIISTALILKKLEGKFEPYITQP